MATDVNFGQQQYFGFEPRMIPGCQLWLDGADSNVLFTDSAGTIPVGSSGNIGMWKDKSGVGRNYIQATGGNRPSFANNTVTCSTSSQLLTSTVALGIAGIDIFVVGKPLPAAGNSWRTLLRGGTTDHPILVENGATRLGYFVNAIGFNPFGSLTLDGSTRALLYVSIPASRIASAALNGTVTLSSGTNAMSASADLQTLGNNTAAGQPWGDINEVIFLSNTTSAQRQQVEGYLAWKWGLTANLPVSHPYKTNPPAMRLFHPTDVIPCSLWLDAADASTVSTPVTSAITQWRDKSGNGNNTTSIGAATYAPNVAAFNNLNCVSNVTNLTGPITASGTTQLTMIVVGSVPAVSGTYWTALALNSSVQATAATNFYSAGNAFLAYYGGNPNVYGFSAGNMSLSTPITYGQPFLWIGQVSGATTNTWGYGTFYGTEPVTSATYTYSGYWVGGPSPAGPAWPGNIGEIIVYGSNISSSDRQQLEGYLAWKWGLRTSLPSTHPFRNFLPATPLFTPPLLNNCALWFDAADRSTITGSSPVTAWVNKGSIVTSAATTTGTSTSGNTFNGLNYINIPSGSEMRFTAAINTQARSWFLVARATTAFTANPQFWGPVNATASGRDGLVVYSDTSIFLLYNGPNGIDVNVSGYIADPFNRVGVYALVNSATTALNVVTDNGTSVALADSVAAGSFNTGSAAVIIGTAGYARGNDIMEIILYYGDLTPSDRRRVEGYLAWKWGLQNNLPTTHPYYKFRP